MLIREGRGGVDPEPTPENPTPKLDRLGESSRTAMLMLVIRTAKYGTASGLELVDATPEEDIKRRDLYDGAPLLATWDPKRRLAPWAAGRVAICGDAAHPMMPNLGQGGCQSTEDGYRLAEELATVTEPIRRRALWDPIRGEGGAARPSAQGSRQLGSDALADVRPHDDDPADRASSSRRRMS